MELEKGELKALETVEAPISAYCRTRVRLGLCDNGDCKFCEMHRAYEVCDPAGYFDEFFKK